MIVRNLFVRKDEEAVLRNDDMFVVGTLPDDIGELGIGNPFGYFVVSGTPEEMSWAKKNGAVWKDEWT